MNRNAYSPAPDWVVLGQPDLDGGVIVIASTELTRAQLEMEREMDEDWNGYMFRLVPGAPTYRITCEMRRYVVIKAATYADAFAHLSKTWNPDQPKPQAREIEQRLAVEA